MSGGGRSNQSIQKTNKYTDASRLAFIKVGIIQKDEPLNVVWPMGMLLGET